MKILTKRHRNALGFVHQHRSTIGIAGVHLIHSRPSRHLPTRTWIRQQRYFRSLAMPIDARPRINRAPFRINHTDGQFVLDAPEPHTHCLVAIHCDRCLVRISVGTVGVNPRPLRNLPPGIGHRIQINHRAGLIGAAIRIKVSAVGIPQHLGCQRIRPFRLTTAQPRFRQYR